MARLASRQLAGYYPTPPEVLPAIASLLHWPMTPDRYFTTTYLLDPCAGDGGAGQGAREEP